MKQADARAWIATPELMLALRPALESVIQSRQSPDYILRQARALRAQIEHNEPLTYPSLFLSIYLAPFLGQTNAEKALRAQLWQWDQQLSTLIREGKVSSLIWKSFQALDTARQDQLRYKNKTLRLYAQLFYLLKKPAEHLDLLAKLVTEDSTFVSQQLEHDAELRKQYLFALSQCKKSKFRTLIELVVRTPVFAQEFVDLLTIVKDRKIDNISPEYRGLCQTLSESLLNDASITNALLKNSELCQRHPELVAGLLINRKGAVAEYKAKLESVSWLIVNGLRGFLAAILPSFLLRFMEPAINAEIVCIIEETPRDFKPTINPNDWKPQTKGLFNHFRRSAAADNAANQDSITIEASFLGAGKSTHPPVASPIRFQPEPPNDPSPIQMKQTSREQTLDLSFDYSPPNEKCSQ